SQTMLLDLLNGLFTRKMSDAEPVMNTLGGDIELPMGGKYRILGMRPVRDEQNSHDYDVIRVWSKEEGTHPREGNTHVLKIGPADVDADDFLQECRLLLAMSDEYPNWRQRRHFIEVLGVGTLKSLFVHGKRCDDEYKEHKLTTPRAFFITERLPITLEDVRFLSRNRFVDPQLSIYLAIGMLKGIRLLHEMGWVMREVAPSRFSIRLPASALLFRYVSEISDRVTLTNLSWASRYRGDRKTRISDYNIYNMRYGSPDVIDGICQGPKDDVYSVFYILLEFLLGFLPWENQTNLSKLDAVRHKRNAMVTKVITDKGGPIFNDWCDLFSTVAEADTDCGMIPYDKLYEMLIRQTNSTKPDISIIGFLYHLRRQYYEASADKSAAKKKEAKSATKDC
ncbi:hypothetical protein PFISCL1PPCAC_6872, partial [Pristionchus fissidentatus]